MTKRMLIDSSHAEQTRVVIMEDNTLLEYDSEVSSQRNLKGNIYLAKITRVEPSLQAAFVDYGGNRHGFLPFSEIHPDYYRIPVADREALLAEQARARRANDFDDDDDVEASGASGDLESNGDSSDARPADDEDGETAALDADGSPVAYADTDDDGDGDDEETDDDTDGEDEDGKPRQRRSSRGRSNGRSRRSDNRSEQDRRRGARMRRSYTIQEVIKRGQIMLVQVVKEERGTKGAAVTTYLSLAGRYCVLMPNTARGGGISRKITVGKDRKRLKGIVDSLEIPGGMAVIVRTAGIGRTKTEIKRDFDFLAKTWEQIRAVTLQSRAPALIYEESQLIKRVLRDTYSREIEEVLVQGDAAYREAKDFMKTLMPSHAKRVQPYKDSSPPLFHRFRVDAQLEHLHSPIVQLRSGGYLVINLTEALVAIDVNSGRATRERHIEETALKTNLEAAEEIARQLRLRDLAGLIVIDFIDMEDRRNNSAVERKLKDALRNDRARVQTGRISSLGLLELSRQRLRPSLLETMMQTCPHCSGTGRIHSTATSALHVLRALEDHGLRGNAGIARVTLAPDVAFYILNDKRDELTRFERDYNLFCRFEPDSSLIAPDMRVEMLERTEAPNFIVAPLPPPLPVEVEEDEVEEETAKPTTEAKQARGNGQQRKSRRSTPEAEEEAESGDDSNRRRGRRGGRRRRRDGEDETSVEASGPIAPPAAEQAETATDSDGDQDTGGDTGRSSRSNRRRRRRKPRPETRNLPGVAVFARAATPLAFHLAPTPDVDSEAEEQTDSGSESQSPAPSGPVKKKRPNRAKRSGIKNAPPAPAAEETGTVAEAPATVAEQHAAPATVTAGNEPAETERSETVPAAAESSEPAPESAATSLPPAAETKTDEEAEPQPRVEAEATEEKAEANPATAEPEPEPEPEPAPEPEPEPAMAGDTAAEPEARTSQPANDRPRRRGWWQRLLE